MWYTGDYFFYNLTLWKTYLWNDNKSLTTPTKLLFLLSEFGQFGPIQFWGSRRAAWLHFISIQISLAQNQKLANSVGGSLECACSMAPQLDRLYSFSKKQDKQYWAFRRCRYLSMCWKHLKKTKVSWGCQMFDILNGQTTSLTNQYQCYVNSFCPSNISQPR